MMLGALPRDHKTQKLRVEVLHVKHRNHATLPLHATLIFLPAIGRNTAKSALSSRYTGQYRIHDILHLFGTDFAQSNFSNFEAYWIVIPTYCTAITIRQWAVDDPEEEPGNTGFLLI